MLSNILKMSALAGVLALPAVGMTSAPASAAIYETHCDRFGGDCYRVRCDNDGDDCVRVSYYGDRDYVRTAYRHWLCDADGCRWTYSYDNYRRHYDDDDFPF